MDYFMFSEHPAERKPVKKKQCDCVKMMGLNWPWQGLVSVLAVFIIDL